MATEDNRESAARDRELDIATRVTIRENDFRWNAHEDQHRDLVEATLSNDTNLANSLEVALNNHQRLHDEMRADRKAKDEDLADSVESTRVVLANSLKVALDDHQRVHDQIRDDDKTKISKTETALKIALEDHHREHVVHADAHEREHASANLAVSKAEAAMERRLEGMNEFRAQLNTQANTFTTRDIFDRYVKEHEEKANSAISSGTERFNSQIASIIDRHDKDIDSLEQMLKASEEKEEAVIRSVLNRHESDYNGLRDQLQEEREIRKKFEGSVNTFKYLVGLFGVSGIAGIIFLFAQNSK